MKKQPSPSMAPAPTQVDIGILTIRNDEFRAVLDAFPDKAGIFKGKTREYTLRHADAGHGERYMVAVLRQVEQGNGEAQDAARDLLDDLAPKLVLVVGIAGALPSDDVKLGDVVLSTRIHDFTVEARKAGQPPAYAASGGAIAKALAAAVANLAAREDELGNWTDGLPAQPSVSWTRKGQLYGPQKWQGELRAKLEHHYPKRTAPRAPVYIAGTIASSDRLVKDPKLLFPWVATARDILAVEMESGGVYRAARERCPMLAIRGISDIVGLKRSDAWTKYACASAAAFTRAFLRTHPIGTSSSTTILSSTSTPRTNQQIVPRGLLEVATRAVCPEASVLGDANWFRAALLFWDKLVILRSRRESTNLSHDLAAAEAAGAVEVWSTEEFSELGSRRFVDRLMELKRFPALLVQHIPRSAAVRERVRTENLLLSGGTTYDDEISEDAKRAIEDLRLGTRLASHLVIPTAIEQVHRAALTNVVAESCGWPVFSPAGDYSELLVGMKDGQANADERSPLTVAMFNFGFPIPTAMGLPIESVLEMRAAFADHRMIYRERVQKLCDAIARIPSSAGVDALLRDHERSMDDALRRLRRDTRMDVAQATLQLVTPQIIDSKREIWHTGSQHVNSHWQYLISLENALASTEFRHNLRHRFLGRP